MVRDNEYAIKVAKINDEFRSTAQGVTVTKGVMEMEALPQLLSTVKNFSNFTSDNDPYGEHDFGSINWLGTKVFWKIDYYDESLTYGEDPLSSRCRRILTVMLAIEY
jgi:hypothetical protein